MRLFKQTRDLGQCFDAWRRFEWIIVLLSLISSCFSVSVAVFTRKDFGERYLGWLNLMFGYTIVVNFAFLGNLLGVAAGGRFSFLMTLCWLAFLGASFYHRWEISRKNKRGEEWHSMRIGTSILRLPFSEERIYKVIEPALVLAAGLFMWSIAHIVGIWLIISGLSLLVNNHIVYYFQRQAFLDLRDARIEAKFASGAMAGKPARQTGGYVIASSTIEMVNHDAGLKAAFANLSSDMKNMMDAEPAFGGAKA